MHARRSLVVFLAGLNILLFAVLLIGSYSTPKAFAQSRGGGGGTFLPVTAKAQAQAYDALYVLDVKNDKLHVFYPTSVQQKKYVPTPPRDLRKDFERS